MRSKNTIIDIDERKIPSGLSRRSFLKRLGGGLVIAVAISDFSVLRAEAKQLALRDFNTYLRIGEDGVISCLTGKIEMGQGVITSLAQMMAEELDVTVKDIKMVMGDTDLCPYDQGTWGSLTTRVFGPVMREAAAEARALLLEMGAEALEVPVENLSVENGKIFSTNDRSKSISYAELTKGKKIVKSLKGKAKVKEPSEFKIIGKSYHREDARIKVIGEAKYAGDIRIDGLQYARIVRPPSHDAKLMSIDTSPIKGIEGITVVEEDDLVAVLHESPDVADRAVYEIKTKYEIPESTLNEETIFDYLVDKGSYGNSLEKKGDIDKGREESDKVIESVFYDGYVAHSPIEPHTATAMMEGERIKIWASTQNPFGVKMEVAQTFGINVKNVHVMQVFVGGGFGGKSRNGQAIEAARLAKITGKPVQVAWSRKEEFFYDTFRPAAVVKLNSGINKEGKITFWDYNEYFAGSRGAENNYDIPNERTTSYSTRWGEPRAHPFGTGAWRAPGNNTNTFARESQIDMMAQKAGMDALEFRLNNIKNEQMRGVLKSAADKFGWAPAVPGSGRGYGIACGFDAGTYVALIAEVKVDKKTGKVKVERVVCAQDMGLVINPLGATLQVEGCVIMGLGYALSEDIQFTGGKIHNNNFDDYEIPKFSWTPRIETVLIDAQDQPPQGGGEPAIIAMGGAIANAIYDACGARVMQMPMTPERILAAMA